MKKIIIITFVSLLAVRCSDDSDERPQFCDNYVEGNILVGIDKGLSLKESFEFLNQYEDITISQVGGPFYESGLPSDSLEYLINYLNSKPYINQQGFVGNAYIHYQTGKIIVASTLWDMTPVNQQDWFDTVEALKLTEQSGDKYFSLDVPEHLEKEWVRVFFGQSHVTYANLNCFYDWNW